MSGESAAPSGLDAGEGDDPVELAARVEVLAEENRRLREEYARARRRRYRRTALGLGLVGVVAALGGLALPDARAVLFALAGTGIFAAVLVLYLTPERFVAATVADAVYAAFAENEAALIESLELAGDLVYVPAAAGVRLVVPVHAEADAADVRAGDDLFVLGDDPRGNGLSLVPSAAGLVAELRTALGGELADAPDPLADQLAEAVTAQFELADAATPDVHPADGRAVVDVGGSALGSVDRFDHPTASLFGAGFAAGLGVPVRVEVAAGADAGVVVACRWDPEALDEGGSG